MPGDGEETSREETPPQTQPEAQVRVHGDPRQRNLRQGEEGRGEIGPTGEHRCDRSIIYWLCYPTRHLLVSDRELFLLRTQVGVWTGLTFVPAEEHY